MAVLLMREARSCCEGFSRSQAIRMALASGRPGLAREWDPRMPVPAGAGIDRRRFLLGAAGGLVSVYGAGRLGLTDRLLGDGIAQAATIQSPTSPILVSIFLQGGIDALSVLAPAGNALYQQLRPTLAVPISAGTPFTEDPRLRWHPSATSFAQLHNAGKVIVLPGIGYSSPDMSHFTSRHYWEVGATDTSLQTGWLGRYLDVAGTPTNPLQGLSMDGQMNPTLATNVNPTAAIDRPDDFSLGRPRRRASRRSRLRGRDRPPRTRTIPRRQRKPHLHQPRHLPSHRHRRPPRPPRRARRDDRRRPPTPLRCHDL
jgi:hypothetical protein